MWNWVLLQRNLRTWTHSYTPAHIYNEVTYGYKYRNHFWPKEMSTVDRWKSKQRSRTHYTVYMQDDKKKDYKTICTANSEVIYFAVNFSYELALIVLVNRWVWSQQPALKLFDIGLSHNGVSFKEKVTIYLVLRHST